MAGAEGDAGRAATEGGARAPATLGDLIGRLRARRAGLADECTERVAEGGLLAALTRRQVGEEVAEALDGYLAAMEATLEAIRAWALGLSARLVSLGVEGHEVIGVVLVLREVLLRSLVSGRREDADHLCGLLEAYDPAADRIACTVAVVLLQEHERLLRQHQRAIRELLEVAAVQQSGAFAAPAGRDLPALDGAELERPEGT